VIVEGGSAHILSIRKPAVRWAETRQNDVLSRTKFFALVEPGGVLNTAPVFEVVADHID
jgi:hypothetical protein